MADRGAVLVTGARGLLGHEVVGAARARGYDVVALDYEELDITDASAVASTVGAAAPGGVIHCAAYTAVDRAEDEAELAMGVNRDGTRHVAAAAAGAGAAFVYVSTDYVFDGTKAAPYLPSDATAPLGAYARSKLAGEHAAMAAHPRPLIVRTGWLYGHGGHSFVRTILERAARGEGLQVVDDQFGRPTWTRNLAAGMFELMDAGASGIVHFTDAGEASWLDFAREVLALSGHEVPLRGVSTEAWGASAPRPRYSVLDVTKTEEVLARPLMHWRDALRRFFEEEAQ